MDYTVVLTKDDLEKKVIMNRDDLERLLEETIRRTAEIIEADRIVGVAEIARLFNKSRGAIYEQIEAGNLIPIEDGSNKYRLGDARKLFYVQSKR